jgi:hypothetical protein
VADPSKILAASDKHSAAPPPTYVMSAAGGPPKEKTMSMDFWTVYKWAEEIAILIPALLFFSWVMYTDRKIVQKAAAARRKLAHLPD